MLACTALVGCSSNDEPVVDNQQNEINGDAYITVQFTMSGNSVASSRAFKDNKYLEVDASSDEAKVTSATFYFLDANYQGCADSYPYTGNLNPWTDSAGKDVSIDETAKPIIVIKNPVTTPKYIVAVLNAGDPLANVSKRPSLEQIQANVADYSAQVEGKFVMSNSVYVKDGNVITATEIDPDKIFKTKDDLELGIQTDNDKYVVIPVERVLARVEASVDEKAYKESISTTQNTYKINVAINGWWLANKANDSYLVKKLSKTYPNFAESHKNATGSANEATWWNDFSNTRSYWAESSATLFTNNVAWENASEIEDILYCQENTSATHTKFVAAATLSLEGDTDGTTFVRWAGNIHTEADFINLIANSFQTYVILKGTAEAPTATYFLNGTNTVKDDVAITPDIFDWHYNGKVTGKDADGNDIVVNDQSLKPYEAMIEVKGMENYSLAKVTTDASGNKTYTVVTADAVQTDIRTQIQKVLLWLDGRTYYHTDILHNELAEEVGENKLYAIIRNHLYKLNIVGVEGMGTPVPAPDQVIDPETPSDDNQSYLAAEIQILSYKVVPTQNVILQ